MSWCNNGVKWSDRATHVKQRHNRLHQWAVALGSRSSLEPLSCDVDRSHVLRPSPEIVVASIISYFGQNFQSTLSTHVLRSVIGDKSNQCVDCTSPCERVGLQERLDGGLEIVFSGLGVHSLRSRGALLVGIKCRSHEGCH